MVAAIREKYVDLIFKGNISENAARICEKYSGAEIQYNDLIQSEIDGAFYWADIDYSNQDRGEWHCAEHC